MSNDRSVTREERRAKTIAGAIVSVIIAVLIVIGGTSLWRARGSNDAVSDGGTSVSLRKTVSDKTVKPSRTDNQGGILISANGYGSAIGGVPTIGIYMDFLCPVCGSLHRALDPTLSKLVEAGQINLDLHIISFGDTARWRSSDGYSGRSANIAYRISDIDDDPNHLLGFIRNIYSQDFQPEEGSLYRPVSDESLVEQASDAGVVISSTDDLSDGRYAQWLTAVNTFTVKRKELQNANGSFSSPTITINGEYWNMYQIVAGAEDVPEALLDAIGLDGSQVGVHGVVPKLGDGR